MKYFSLFSGVGGFELAINNVYDNRPNIRNRDKTLSEVQPITTEREGGTTCVGFSEIDKYAISVYQYHYPNHKNYGDISKIEWNTVPDFDLVVGGSPCQDLSVAGKQKGLSGARSGLFFEFVRCLKEKQPTNFIWENVKGALSSSNGWDFARVQIEFSEAGYDIEWQVLNAKDFGVPQNRERIFVVGHLRGKSRPKVFPIRTSSVKIAEECDRSFVDLTRREALGYKKRKDNRAGTIDANYYKGMANQERPGVIHQVNQPTHSNDRVYSDDGISPSLNTMQGGRRQPKIQIKEATKQGYAEATVGDSINFSVPNSKTRRGRVGHGVAQTLDTASNQGTIDGTRIRRLTPLECERLMSWPDDWTKTGITGEISDTQRYKMCGNGVVSKVIEPIIEKLWNNTPTTWE